WAQSGRYAAGLAAHGVKPGDKLCLIYPTCAEFFYTFFGAVRLGAVPVPMYPTLSVDATANVFRNSDAVAVATIGWFRSGVDQSVALAPNIREVLEPPDLDVDGTPPALAEPGPEDLAFLQYTSGSTGEPRGVMLTHDNLIETCHFMAAAAGLTPEDRVVSWLPLYHDMGLIGLSFTPPLMAAPVWLLPPDLRNPRQWLELMTQVRATFTVSPDFGYRNCVRNVRDTSDLDLTSLKAALSGAEPVRLATIRGFEEHFGVKNVIAPCYGLAEATLAVGVESERTGTQRLHVVAEVRDESAAEDAYHGLVREIVHRVHTARGHRPARVLLVRSGTIPKTSSGKIQRSRLGQMIDDGALR